MTPSDQLLDPLAPLEPGTAIFEASAGTGKTYQLTNLVLKLVAEQGIEPERILVVTFTRAATAELRDRIRRRFQEARDALAGLQVEDDFLLAWAERAAAEGRRALYLRRLGRARAELDQLPVSTIHGFCHRSLQQYAFESRTDFSAELLEDLSPLLEELVDDFLTSCANPLSPEQRELLKRWGLLQRDRLLELAEGASDQPELRLSPVPPSLHPAPLCELLRELDPEQPDQPERNPLLPFLRSLFAEHARRELQRRLAERRALGLHDLVLRLLDELRRPGGRLRDILSAHYRAALIDEFQDTDLQQWEIFRLLFADDAHHLFLIGDPKQAIYGFRGADVQAYLQARESVDRRYTLLTNHRSDGPLLRALDAIFQTPTPCPEDVDAGECGPLGTRGIPYQPVRPRPGHERLRGLQPAPGQPWPAPLRLRLLRDEGTEPPSREAANSPSTEGIDAPSGKTAKASSKKAKKGKKGMKVTELEKWLPARVAADIRELLDQPPLLVSERRPLEPGDVAVLVRKRRHLEPMRDALAAEGIPAVVRGSGNVLERPAAEELRLWLRALAQPSGGAARAAAATRAFGRGAAELASSGEDDPPWWDDWLAALQRWRELLDQRGLLPAFHEALRSQGVVGRLLGQPGGEALLAELLEVAELLHAEQQRRRFRLEGLLQWYEARLAEAEPEVPLRLPREGGAVQILTIHGAKGLQFPVVFLPYAWAMGSLKRELKPLLVPAEEGTPRLLDVSPKPLQDTKGRSHLPEAWRPLWDTYQHNFQRAWRAAMQEELRLLYVALTRAQHQLVLYAGWLNDLGKRPLGVLLHAYDETPEGPRIEAAEKRCKAMKDDQTVRSDLERLARRAGRDEHGPLVAVEPCGPPGPPSPRSRPTARLRARSFQRGLRRRRWPFDWSWGASSFSRLAELRQREEPAPVERAARDEPEPDPRLAREPFGELGPEGLPPAWLELLRAAPGAAEDAPDVPLAPLPGGPDAGHLVHALLEQLSFEPFHRAPEEGREALRELARRLAPRYGLREQVELLVEALPAALQTPLGGELGDFSLSRLPDRRRLSELDFHLPLARSVDGRALGEALAEAVASSGPFEQGYLDELARGWDRLRFSGFLVGTIDLLFSPEEGRPFYVLDYKTNRVDLLGEERHPREHFQPAWLRVESMRHDYPVQAVLYLLAAHRYLRHRLGSAYDYERHLGGAIYAFLRGMTGPGPGDADPPWGLLHLRPSARSIERLDALLDGRGGAR